MEKSDIIVSIIILFLLFIYVGIILIDVEVITINPDRDNDGGVSIIDVVVGYFEKIGSFSVTSISSAKPIVYVRNDGFTKLKVLGVNLNERDCIIEDYGGNDYVIISSDEVRGVYLSNCKVESNTLVEVIVESNRGVIRDKIIALD